MLEVVFKYEGKEANIPLGAGGVENENDLFLECWSFPFWESKSWSQSGDDEFENSLILACDPW